MRNKEVHLLQIFINTISYDYHTTIKCILKYVVPKSLILYSKKYNISVFQGLLCTKR